MTIKTILRCLALPALVSAFPPFHHGAPPTSSDGLTVSTTSGHVHGKVDPALPNVHQFLGIPYAVPPVGNLRWTAPQLLDQPSAKIDATELPVSCMQYVTNQGNSLYVRDVLQFNLQGLNTTGAISEDCLTVSVWAPSNATTGKQGGHHWSSSVAKSEGLPVLIFIYGGGFSTGGVDVPYQIPAQWVNRTPDHIVVSLNYRVNVFGFPNAAGLGEQNFGLLDQRAVVKWCQKNIAAFGGDPDRMVIWGQSAGSVSVDMYNFAYPTDPIVSGLIMDSGTAFTPSTTDDTTHSNFTFIAENVGCSGLASEPAQQLACMRNVSAAKIEDFFASYQESGVTPALGFDPVVDGTVVFANYTERALAGDLTKVPAIIGNNAQDGVPFVTYHPTGPSNQTLVVEAMLTKFFCPATETIRLRQQTGRLTHRYYYAGNFSNIAPKPWMGAYHSSELPMLMGTHPDFRGPSTALEYETSHAFQDAYVAFATDPVNGLVGQDWTPYTQIGAGNVREFGAGVAAQDTSVAAIETLCDGPVPAAPL